MEKLSSMAEGEHPVAELHPPGIATSLESSLSADAFLLISKSSTEEAASLGQTQLPGEPINICKKAPNEAVNEINKDRSAPCPTGGANSSSQRVRKESGEQVAGKHSQHSGNPEHPSEHCSVPKALIHPLNIAETYTFSHQQEKALSAATDSPHVGRSMAQGMQPASLPVRRSHSDYLPLVKQGLKPQALDSETCGENANKVAEGQSMLTCKKSMLMQHGNIIATVCQEANSIEGGLLQQPQCGRIHIPSPKAATKVEDVEEKGRSPPQCENTILFGSYIHNPNFEDTFAAYCHPQPIPPPSQLLPGLAGIESSCSIQRAAATNSATNHLTLPRLISSVSETGLDAKHLLRCCNLNCSWISSFNPGGVGPQSPQHAGGEERCSSPIGHVRITTRNMGTMTTHKKLRDVGVQTGQTVAEPGTLHIPLHVFPQICLAEESQSATSDNDSDRKPGAPPKSPVKEVKWDAEGMTWEVYGASVDPEELGLAIQKHLELQIKETASRAAKLSRQNTNTSRQSSSASCHRKRSGMMSSIRTPACCARTTTAVD